MKIIMLIGITLAINAFSNPVANLSQAIKFKTVSLERGSKQFDNEFQKYHQFLKKTYPRTFSELKVISINLSFLLIWEGTDSTAPNILFNAHQDVVPVEDKDLPSWKYPPYSGKIADDHIWGRGSLDDKIGIHSYLEAIERLLKEGHKPKGSLYFALTHDEEIGGWHGAHEIANYIRKNKISIDSVFDEGLLILTDALPNITRPIALVGIAEKGYATLKIQTFKKGGHSSMPAEETAITILNRALARISNPLFHRTLSEPLKQFFESVGKEITGLFGFVLRNPVLFEPVLVNALKKSRSGDALLRTTRAITVVHAGVKDNKIPNQAEALVNFRILPGNSVQEILELVKTKINDPRVKVSLVEPKDAVNPSPLSPTNTIAYQKVTEALKKIYPDIIVAPNIMIARTDSYHYQSLTPNIYRFHPIKIAKKEARRIHGINERISLENFEKTLEYYYLLIHSL